MSETPKVQRFTVDGDVPVTTHDEGFLVYHSDYFDIVSSLRSELQEKERALAAANERAEEAEATKRAAMQENAKLWNDIQNIAQKHLFKPPYSEPFLRGCWVREVEALRSSLEKAKGEMRGMVRVDPLLRIYSRDNSRHPSGRIVDLLIYISERRASRSKGEHHD